MIHFIIINWFNRGCVYIWKWFRVKFKWKIWSVNFHITIINGMIIKSPHDSLNHRDGVVRIVPGFEVSCCRLVAPLSWWFIWFMSMKAVELINIYYNTWWEEFFTTYDVGISFVSNSSTAFVNTLLYCAYICNKWMGRWCIIFYWRWRDEMMRALTWGGQCCWRSNHLEITIYSINFSSCIYSRFSVVVKECDQICHIGRNLISVFITLWQFLHVLEWKSGRRDNFSREHNLLL